ncbi:MAG: zf-HC2 domain-containing protein [Acidobacteriota bacterium]|nr:zf-HC2 domain-containing protein [Acidobacteriota bacterium]
MKQPNNQEVDLLLRSLARGRRAEESPSPGGSTSGGENPARLGHLDADELNSYAEGVLPAPARARYTEHLADCENCRRLATGLTQAAGATGRYEVLDERKGSGFWSQLGAFFSPAVLRYAVPALALTAIIAISLIALRQPRRPEFVAVNQPTDSPAASSESGQTELRSPTEPTAAPQRRIEAKANDDASDRKKELSDEKSKLDQAPSTSTSGTSTKPSPLKDSAKSGQAGGVGALSPSFAPEPSPPPPASRPVPSEANEITTIAKEQSAEREDQVRQREQDKNQPRDSSASQRLSKAGAIGRSARRVPESGMESTTESRAGGKDKKESIDEVETRTVSGRHFRRQSNTWIDTAYDSSRATVNVARGSEQFRSLVADEPGIRAIAAQLAGEVIVVWKGKAYRIH